jgi:hypothetical protein
MKEEYGALMSNGTWELVSQPRSSNVITDKWVFTHKFLSDGIFDRYKARWVLRGFTQYPRVDYDETFSPVVKTDHRPHGAHCRHISRLPDSTAQCEERLPQRHPQ